MPEQNAAAEFEPRDTVAAADAALDPHPAPPASLLDHALPDAPFPPSTLPPAALFDHATGRSPHAATLASLVEVVATPRSHPPPLRHGDIVARKALAEGGMAHLAILCTGEVVPVGDLAAHDLRAESTRPGGYVQVVESGAVPHGTADRFARRITDRYGLVRTDTAILRPRPMSGPTAGASDAATAAPPAPSENPADQTAAAYPMPRWPVPSETGRVWTVSQLREAGPPTVTLTARNPVVLVGKPGSTPARVPITLGLRGTFTGHATLTRASAAVAATVRLFPTKTGGEQLTLDGTDNAFAAAALRKGITLFADAVAASPASGDFKLTLALDPAAGATSAALALTAVELTVDVALTRTSAATDPPTLSAADKIGTGRFVQVADPGFSHERAMLVIHPPAPADFTGTLVLRAAGPVRAYTAETPAARQEALPARHTVAAPLAANVKLFVDATAVSKRPGDAAFRLGVDGIDDPGDRVNLTAVQIEATATATSSAPPLTFVRYGLWDKAYDAVGEVRNGSTETTNFIGRDRRKLHFRVRDVAASGHVDLNWRTVRADRTTDDDAPVTQTLTLPAASTGSTTFLSRSVMHVTDDTDRDFPTNSLLKAPFDIGLRNAGQSNHRTRRAALDGFSRVDYSPAAGTVLRLVLPLFDRVNDERRRVDVRVVRYTGAGSVATDADIADQFAIANARWNQVGIRIDRQAPTDLPIPAAALDGSGQYGGDRDNANEQAALADLIPRTPDDTLTAVFVRCSLANAYAVTNPRAPIPNPADPAGGTLALDNRHFIFIDSGLDPDQQTLAHELHHVLFNRLDLPTRTGDLDHRKFLSFNTNPPRNYWLSPGNVRVVRRIHDKHSPNPDNDATHANVINWARRIRTTRYPIAGSLEPAATASTGNRLAQPL